MAHTHRRSHVYIAIGDLQPGEYLAIGRCHTARGKTESPGGNSLEIWGGSWQPYNRAMHVGAYIAICPRSGPEQWPPLLLRGRSIHELVVRIQLYLKAPSDILPCKTCYDERHAPMIPNGGDGDMMYLNLLNAHEAAYQDSPRSNADWEVMPDRRTLKCLGCGNTKAAF